MKVVWDRFAARDLRFETLPPPAPDTGIAFRCWRFGGAGLVSGSSEPDSPETVGVVAVSGWRMLLRNGMNISEEESSDSGLLERDFWRALVRVLVSREKVSEIHESANVLVLNAQGSIMLATFSDDAIKTRKSKNSESSKIEPFVFPYLNRVGLSGYSVIKVQIMFWFSKLEWVLRR